MMDPDPVVHQERHRVKDHILRSLQKLNDRDTQRTAISELHDTFQVRPCCASSKPHRAGVRRFRVLLSRSGFETTRACAELPGR